MDGYANFPTTDTPFPPPPLQTKTRDTSNLYYYGYPYNPAAAYYYGGGAQSYNPMAYAYPSTVPYYYGAYPTSYAQPTPQLQSSQQPLNYPYPRSAPSRPTSTPLSLANTSGTSEVPQDPSTEGYVLPPYANGLGTPPVNDFPPSFPTSALDNELERAPSTPLSPILDPLTTDTSPIEDATTGPMMLTDMTTFGAPLGCMMKKEAPWSDEGISTYGIPMTGGGGVSKRKNLVRVRFSDAQRRALEQILNDLNGLVRGEKDLVGRALGITNQQVINWFTNAKYSRKAKTGLNSVEFDMNYDDETRRAILAGILANYALAVGNPIMQYN